MENRGGGDKTHNFGDRGRPCSRMDRKSDILYRAVHDRSTQYWPYRAENNVSYAQTDTKTDRS